MTKARDFGKERKMDARLRDDMMGGEVEKWIRVSGLPKPELCKLMDIGMTTLNERLRRPGEFRVQELRVLADIVGIDASQLIV